MADSTGSTNPFSSGPSPTAAVGLIGGNRLGLVLFRVILIKLQTISVDEFSMMVN
jgi:hypothetical protein